MGNGLHSRMGATQYEEAQTWDLNVDVVSVVQAFTPISDWEGRLSLTRPRLAQAMGLGECPGWAGITPLRYGMSFLSCHRLVVIRRVWGTCENSFGVNYALLA